MEQGNRDDEGQIEPVRHIDVRLFPLPQRSEEDEEIDHPDERQPDIGIPFRLGVFPSLGDSDQIAGGSDHDEELITPEDKPGPDTTGDTRPAGPLDHIEGRRNQHISAEGEDHRRGVQGTQATEAGEPESFQIEHRKGQLEGDDDADQKTGDTPEERGDNPSLDEVFIVLALIRDDASTGDRADQQDDTGEEAAENEPGLAPHGGVRRVGSREKRPHRTKNGDEKNDGCAWVGTRPLQPLSGYHLRPRRLAFMVRV